MSARLTTWLTKLSESIYPPLTFVADLYFPISLHPLCVDVISVYVLVDLIIIVCDMHANEGYFSFTIRFNEQHSQ